MLTAKAPEPPKAPARPIVLRIDDDPLVLHFYQDFLAAYGNAMVTATDGLVGIQLARHRAPT